MRYKLGKNCYLFHSFVGMYQDEFLDLMNKEHGRPPDPEKFMAFYEGGNNIEKLEESLGLNFREVMCCVSKTNPAVTYHRPYGLILSGEVKIMFDHDSGIRMLVDGTYPSKAYYEFANEVDLQTLMTKWYDHFITSTNFNWNEAVLRKGSKIVGAFHDPFFDPEFLRYADYCTYKEKEYSKFLEKVKQLKLDILEVNARFK